MSKNLKNLTRETAPVFTSGFRFGIADSIAIVDFIDAPDEETRKILFSVGITKNQAKGLVEQLSEFLADED